MSEKIKCPNCQKNDANIDFYLGILICDACKLKRSKNSLPSRHYVEFTSDSIKRERIEYAKSSLQPRMGVEPSREFIEAYPETAKETFTEKEIKNAKYVYKGIPELKHWRESK